jgi:hypothetical protein
MLKFTAEFVSGTDDLRLEITEILNGRIRSSGHWIVFKSLQASRVPQKVISRALLGMINSDWFNKR